jgi:translation initiation factor IF-1
MKNTDKKESALNLNGVVTKILNGTMYRVQLENGIEILGHLSGRMRKFGIKITIGDKVALEMSPYDLTKGRITYRFKV